MSYKRSFPEDTDSLSVLFSIMDDCLLACKQMMRYKDDPAGFIRWYDKAKIIDPRTTYLFVKKNWDELNPHCQFLCRSFMDKCDRKKAIIEQRISVKKEGL